MAADDSKPKPRLPILTTSQIWELLPPGYLMPGIIPDSGLMGLFGPANIGKTFILISWLICLRLGLEWCGRRAVETEVLLITDEGERGLGIRERAMCAMHGITVVPEFPHGLGMINLLDEAQMRQDVKELEAQGINPGLIAIDTFGSAIATGDETRDMPKAMTNARLLSHLIDGTIVLSHHPTKDGKYERGGGQFRNKVDVLVEVLEVPGAPNLRTLHFEKTREDERPPDLMFGLEKQSFMTPWGMKTSLGVSGLKTVLDMPSEGMTQLENTIRSVFTEQFPEGGTWTELYDATSDLTANERKKDQKLDRKTFSAALRSLVENGAVIDEAGEVSPRPKGSKYRLLKIQSVQPKRGSEEGVREEDKERGQSGAESVGGRWDPTGSPPPPTDPDASDQLGGSVSTDLHRHQPKVEQPPENGSEAPDPGQGTEESDPLKAAAELLEKAKV
jgi:hypothetical protein